MSGGDSGWPRGRCGFVALVGRPNVGKSTLLNQVLDFHLAAVSSTPQTTRRHWRGILSTADSQIVFVDTPGAHEGPTQLNSAMIASIDRGLQDADAVLCLADPTRAPGDEDAMVARRVSRCRGKVFLLLNKADVASADQQQRSRQFYLHTLGAATPVFAVCALTGEGLDPVLGALRQALPVGPFLYDPEDVTDALSRDLGAEMIREAAFAHLREEVPHCLAVAVDEWREGPKRVSIRATLFVERDTQRSIVIGQGGQTVAAIRRAAIPALRELAGQPVTLSLYVKVARDWRNRRQFLADLGLADG